MTAGKPIYLDYNATTPHAPEVIEAMRPYLETDFGNPSSGHIYGRRTRDAVAKAREQVALLLGCQPGHVVFTSGGSESNNYAIKGVALAHRAKGNHIITSQVEHPAVTEVCKHLASHGFEITYLPVDEFGSVSVEDLEEALTPQTILISIMHANNEVGTIQPIEEIAEIARSREVIFHTDAAQSAGKIPCNVQELGVDLLSIAGHKMYGPKGIGALYIRPDLELEPLMHGANQEGGRRPGTENVLEISGIGMACQLAAQGLEKNMNHLLELRDALDAKLREQVQDVLLNGHPKRRLPNTLSLAFRDVDANRLLEEIGDQVAASTGAACHSDVVSISAVLAAMRVPEEWALGTLRLSVGKMTTMAEIDRAAEAIAQGISSQRE